MLLQIFYCCFPEIRLVILVEGWKPLIAISRLKKILEDLSIEEWIILLYMTLERFSSDRGRLIGKLREVLMSALRLERNQFRKIYKI